MSPRDHFPAPVGQSRHRLFLSLISLVASLGLLLCFLIPVDLSLFLLSFMRVLILLKQLWVRIKQAKKTVCGLMPSCALLLFNNIMIPFCL